MPARPDQFDHLLPFDPDGDFEAFLKGIPARQAVCLLADATGRPVQLLCVANLRRSIERRLGPPEPTADASRRVDYRGLIRHVYWQVVDSPFEADIAYLEIARDLFPKTYRGMIGFRAAWFVHVDPDAAFPRYTKTTDPVAGSGLVFGPLEDKNSAARLIELLEDAFDLCRYHNILTQAPSGLACAYKEMGKCPAPCDGSISMEQYRRMIQGSAAFLQDPRSLLAEQHERMTAAAKELQFETAARIKGFIDILTQVGKGAFRHVQPLDQFAMISLQRGPRPQTAHLFLITAGKVRQCASLTGLSTDFSCLLDHVRGELAAMAAQSLDARGAERLGIVAHYLFAPRSKPGHFVPAEEVCEKTLAAALRQLHKKGSSESEKEDHGKELSVSNEEPGQAEANQ